MEAYVLIINGAVGGAHGNTSVLLHRMVQLIEVQRPVRWLNLSEPTSVTEWERLLDGCGGIVIGTGTYWDSWGSPLQHFLEQMTHTEGTTKWLGKPTAVLITMHSVGGKSVLSRLQGVLNTLGVLLPPMSGLVYSAAADSALRSLHDAQLTKDPRRDSVLAIANDLWRIEDLSIVANNLLQALGGTTNWQAWPVDRADPSRRWLEKGWK